jgi:murein DD-endopeptidase MepM/ murein hydrolase activator NlpD
MDDRTMIDRRMFLAAAMGFVAPETAFGQSARTALLGALKQGELIVGRTQLGAAVTLDGTALLVSPDGRFAFGFPYDRKTVSRLDVRFPDGTREMRELTPVARSYDIQRISGLPEAFVSPPPDILERIKKETALFRQARERDIRETWFANGFDWPLPGIISSVYGSQRILNGEPRAPHLGVDVAAPTGTPIHAPAEGVVSVSGDYYLDGGFTILDHGHGVSTNYGHQSKMLVAVGDHVVRGQIIGEVGQTGRATGPNLHWGMNWFQVALDPSLSTRMPAPSKS